MGLIYGTLLVAVFAAPAAATLSAATYSSLGIARFLAYLASLLVYLVYGRQLARDSLPRLRRGILLGAVSAFLGTLLYAYLTHLPVAQFALLHTLPGVPATAIATMLRLHQKTGALLSGAVAACLNGALGGLATWWAGRPGPDLPPEPEERGSDQRASGF